MMRYLTLVHPSAKWFILTGKVDQNNRVVGSNASIYTAILKIETNLNHATDKTLHDIADTFDVGFEWLKFGDERYRKSPVNRKLVEWLMDHQEIRDQLWKKMLDEEQN